MMHKAVVKVCGIREPENAREIARCLPDYMGFIFVPESPRYIPPNAWQALLQSVPATTRTVGVFRNALLEELEITVRQLGLTAVQLHGEEDEAYISECRARVPSCQVFKAVSVDESSLEFLKLPMGVDLLIFDAARPGSGLEFNWRSLEEYRGDVPFLLAGGIGPENLGRAKQFAREHPRCIGIDINSKVEVRAGVKDVAAVRNVIQGVRL